MYLFFPSEHFTNSFNTIGCHFSLRVDGLKLVFHPSKSNCLDARHGTLTVDTNQDQNQFWTESLNCRCFLWQFWIWSCHVKKELTWSKLVCTVLCLFYIKHFLFYFTENNVSVFPQWTFYQFLQHNWLPLQPRCWQTKACISSQVNLIAFDTGWEVQT